MECAYLTIIIVSLPKQPMRLFAFYLVLLSFIAKILCNFTKTKGGTLVMDCLDPYIIPPASVDEQSLQSILHGVRQDQSDALYHYSLLKIFGSGVEKDIPAAFKILKRLTSRSHSGAEFVLGIMYGNEACGVSTDSVASIGWLRASSNHGNAEAKWVLGTMFADGIVVEQDAKLAFELLQESANLRNPKAYFHVGMMYEYGRGVAQDYVKAAQNYEQGRKLQDANAVYHLALMHLHGRNFASDVNIARQLLEEASALGSALAMYQLGKLFTRSEVLASHKVDYYLALSWFRKAAQTNDMRIKPAADFAAAEIEQIYWQVRKQIAEHQILLGIPLNIQVAEITA